ncbi:MAG: A/G-specific adenine glycosylase [Methylophagaceae bacterium]
MLNSSKDFSDQLLVWFDHSGRKNLPWQRNVTPYHVWLSEIMLQQTQVATVIPYYQRFVDRYGDIDALSQARLDDVLALWTGLGYYARARNLHKAAIIMVNDHQSEMPNDLEQLIALPGIGRSTAGAIMALAYHQHYPILDGNVKRVLTRYDAITGWTGNKAIEQQLWQRAEQLLPKNRIADYIQAQMDLGATVCTRSKPKCNCCPVQDNCRGFQQGKPSQYPSPKPKKAIPIRKTNWIIAQSSNGKILLQKRPSNGIWGGLWSFPESDNNKSIDYICKNSFNIEVIYKSPQPSIRHVFSHFKLDIHPYIVSGNESINHIDENKSFAWYKIDDALQLGLPSPVKSFLKSLQ